MYIHIFIHALHSGDGYWYHEDKNEVIPIGNQRNRNRLHRCAAMKKQILFFFFLHKTSSTKQKAIKKRRKKSYIPKNAQITRFREKVAGGQRDRALAGGGRCFRAEVGWQVGFGYKRGSCFDVYFSPVASTTFDVVYDRCCVLDAGGNGAGRWGAALLILRGRRRGAEAEEGNDGGFGSSISTSNGIWFRSHLARTLAQSHTHR